MTIYKISIILFIFVIQLYAAPKFQPISSVNLRPTNTWIPGPNNNKYQFHNGWQSWLSAREYCLSQNADLVSINDKQELDWILEHYSNDISGVGERFIQVGLFLSSQDNGEWTWADKSLLNSSFLSFDGTSNEASQKKCSIFMINKMKLQEVMCEVTVNLPDRPTRFICERSNKNHLALEKANNPLWEKFDKILQFLGISEGAPIVEGIKTKTTDKKEDYYSDDADYDSRESDTKKDSKEKLVLLTIVDSKDSKNTKIHKNSNKTDDTIETEGSGEEITNLFEDIKTRKPEDIASSTPITKTDNGVLGEITNVVNTMKELIKIGMEDESSPIRSDDYVSNEYNMYSRLKQNQLESRGLIKVSPLASKINIPPKTRPVINRAVNLLKSLDNYASDYNKKIDTKNVEGKDNVVQLPGSDDVLDNRIIEDNLLNTNTKLSNLSDIKNQDIEGSGEDLIKVEEQKNDETTSLKDDISDQGNNKTKGDVSSKEKSLTNNTNSTGQIDEVEVTNNVEIENVEEKITKFFKVLHEYLKKMDVKNLKEVLDSKEPGVSITEHLKKTLNAVSKREISKIKALDKLYQMGVNLEKVRHDAINTTLEHNAVKTAIKEIEKELTEELIKDMSEEFDEANNLINDPDVKRNMIRPNVRVTLRSNETTSSPKYVPLTSSEKPKKGGRKNKFKGKNSNKIHKNRKGKKGRKYKSVSNEKIKESHKVIGKWNPEIAPTEEQKKQFSALEKTRVKLNNDTYEIFKNFSENERTKKLLERIHQNEMEKKNSSEKIPVTKISKSKSNEVKNDEVDGLLKLVTKTDKTVHNFIDKQIQ
uniref:C-type lectin domain-containing protein n=1 Tax=Parastrongyloides trichosuri TaxID=131310 RepID=A0A0N4ZAV3_PARTI